VVGRILVVDDEEPIAFALREYFVCDGYQVSGTDSLRGAIGLLDSIAHDVVIADYRLSGTDSKEGIELLAHVRACHPDTRVIMLTAYGSEEMELAVRRAGVDALFHKPAPLEAIARCVVGLVGHEARCASRSR
jgi:DNA-binding response OmpR family regulator